MRLFREKNRQIEISAMTYSTLAQLVERATVNRLVPRSSRGGGAKWRGASERSRTVVEQRLGAPEVAYSGRRGIRSASDHRGYIFFRYRLTASQEQSCKT